MERTAAVSILYDTIDTLVAIKIDLRSEDARRVTGASDNLARIGRELDEAIANIRAAIASVEENLAAKPPLIPEASPAGPGDALLDSRPATP